MIEGMSDVSLHVWFLTSFSFPGGIAEIRDFPRESESALAQGGKNEKKKSESRMSGLFEAAPSPPTDSRPLASQAHR